MNFRFGLAAVLDPELASGGKVPHTGHVPPAKTVAPKTVVVDDGGSVCVLVRHAVPRRSSRRSLS